MFAAGVLRVQGVRVVQLFDSLRLDCAHDPGTELEAHDEARIMVL